MEKYQEPIKINQLELANRFVMPPMATHQACDGFINKAHIEYYTERTKGNSVGLLIVEHSYIAISGRTNFTQLGIDSDDKIEGFRQLAAAVHGAGKTKIFGQINHAGNMTKPEYTGSAVVSAGNLVTPTGRSSAVPRPLTPAEIHELTEKYAAAALRFKKAGFDGVEIHAAHGYLLDQFYSPLTNNRTDAYGGSLDNRLRFQLEVLAAVRRAVGADFPVALRLGGCDYLEGGASLEDAVYAAKKFEAARVDLLDISGGMCMYIRKGHSEAGYFADQSAAVKRAVTIPVLVTGGVRTPEEAEKLLEAGTADLIGIGRALKEDGNWARKALRGIGTD